MPVSRPPRLSLRLSFWLALPGLFGTAAAVAAPVTSPLAATPPAAAASTVYTPKLIERAKAWGSATADYNGDGHQDIFVTGHDPNDRIWYWTTKGYIASKQVFPDVDRHACTTADVNGDGRIDLYCAVGADKGTGLKANELWLQGADGFMVAKTGHGAEDPSGRSRIPLFFDLNHDGKPDLYSSNLASPRTDGLPNFNHVFLGHGDGTFSEVSTIATGGLGSQCVVKGDINHDGWDDLLVCDEKSPGHLFVNNHRNDFVELSLPPLAMLEWHDAKLADLDGDGWDDLVLLDANNHLKVWFNKGTGGFTGDPVLDVALPGYAVSLTVGDFNKDRRMDIYVVLQDLTCHASPNSKSIDIEPDMVFWGQADHTWVAERLTTQAGLEGCGHLADTLDGYKVLLENGGTDWVGPELVLSWVK